MGIQHTTDISNINIKQTIFYKSPTPLLIGNLPFGDDFKNKRHEYEYLDYYIVPVNGPVTYDGFLFYSKFFDNYIFLAASYASWSCMYPGIYFNASWYSLNPFVNDTNGACSWIPEFRYADNRDGGLYQSSQIYYNFSKDRYEAGLGEDVWNLDSSYHLIHSKNLSNGLYDSLSDYNTVKMDYQIADSLDDLRNMPLAGNKNGKIPISYAFKLENDDAGLVDVSNLAKRENLYKNFKATVINQKLIDYANSTNNSRFISTPVHMRMLYTATSTPMQYDQYWYERLDLIKDLDYEDDPENFEKMCGLYENNPHTSSLLKQFILGSVVIGNESHRDDLGWFIGVNEQISNYNNFLGATYTTTGGDMYEIQSTNVHIVSKKQTNAPSYDYKVNRENYTYLKNVNAIITLGYTWKSEEKKYLVYYFTSDTEGLYRRFRLFIVDKDPTLLFSQRKIWYADLPVDNSGMTATTVSNKIPALFQHRFYYGVYSLDYFDSLTFNYINLDDEDDVKDPVVFTDLGAVRENAQENLVGFPINKKYMRNRTQAGYSKVNTYIGYWNTPIVNFKDE